MEPVTWACPCCCAPLRQQGDMLICQTDSLQYPRESGTWRLLAPERAEELYVFISEYQRQRVAEKWWSEKPEYYLNLPYTDVTGRQQDLWRLRTRHWRRLLRVLDGVLATPGAVVLDAGAGNCWLSYRLAQLGAYPVALDLNDDAMDGLGVAEVYRQHAGVEITTAQAELERMPLADGQCDAVVINGSLHYVADVTLALGEARRALRPGGILVVMDSPVYRDGNAGRQMMEEWAAQYAQRLGKFPSTLPGKGYLTYGEMQVALRVAGFPPDCIKLWPQYTGVRAAWRWVKLTARPTGAAHYRETATHPMWVAAKQA